MPRPQLEAGSVQQEEGLVKDLTGQLDSGTEHRQVEAGTSSAPIRRKGKNPMVRSSRKHPDTTIIL
jgi:hypothetical protein